MAKMMRKTFERVGRCHPWCGHREYEVGRAAEKKAWIAEVYDETVSSRRFRRGITS